jgi:hypothetical protein
MRPPALCCLLLACASAPARPPVVTGPAVAAGALETLAVGGRPVATAPLGSGQIYLLRASGVVEAGSLGQDAEWAFAADGSGPRDRVGAADVGLDVGVKRVLPALGRKPAPPSTERLKWFPDFRGDHVYYLLVTGAGVPLSLHLVAAGPVTGVLTVSVFRLSPAPPPLGAPLETLMVPAREKVIVRSATRPRSVCLLQAVGEVQVGGPGAMGDAEFHDYHADGSGYNEGEAGVDFGLGIDEPTVGDPAAPTTGPGHPQRRLKWGAFRRDHTYYMLYAGRGEPIAFNYHDSGGKTGVYKDNDGFLPVSIFALP